MWETVEPELSELRIVRVKWLQESGKNFTIGKT